MIPHSVRPPSFDITIDSDGRRLAARRMDGGDIATDKPAILFLHGLHSDQTGYEPRAKAAASSLGAVCLTFDLGGHGRSDSDADSLSLRDHLHDAVAAYDALVASDGVNPERVGVCAASYGGYLAALLVAERPIRRLLLRAPALYADECLDVPLRQRGTLGDVPSSSVALESLGRFDGEVLVVESGRDEVIPHAMVKAYLERCQHAGHEIIAEATHRLADPAWEAQFVRLVLEWFAPL
jgi:pimeloyl-ACP methyl ester carboxylesterase